MYLFFVYFLSLKHTKKETCKMFQYSTQLKKTKKLKGHNIINDKIRH